MQAEKIDYESVTGGLKTKSDKIRALSRRGVPTAEIARFLDIRFQHARNVLIQSGLYKTEGGAEQADAKTQDSAWVTVDAVGRIALPPAWLSVAGLEPGARVYIGQTEDGLELLSRPAALGRAQALARRYLPEGGPSVVDAFIAERRKEAEREND